MNHLIKIPIFPFLFLLVISFNVNAQEVYNYESSAEHPYGLPNPNAPKELLDFAPLIGECACKSVARIDKDNWADTVAMTWKFKYIMNGMAIQDETLKADGKHSGSIRQFITDSASWFVHYYSSGSPTSTLPVWEGNKSTDGNIVLYRDQKAPNGMDGDFRLTFSDITSEGFNWVGEWVSKDGTNAYPTWKIFCQKKRHSSYERDRIQIYKNIEAFSTAYENGDHMTIANSYTSDGKIFPGNSDIIEGTEALANFWTLRNGMKILNHKVTPVELKFIGDYVHDYGYYEGKSQEKDGTEYAFSGKYLIIWKRVGEDWKIYLDIWNTLPKPKIKETGN